MKEENIKTKNTDRNKLTNEDMLAERLAELFILQLKSERQKNVQIRRIKRRK